MRTKELLARLHAVRDAGDAIIVAGVGCGLTAKAAAKGGADLLAVYSTAVYRIRGLPTALSFLPYDNANDLTLSTAPEVMANAGGLPVLFGFGAHDPRTPPEWLVDQARSFGAAGVLNEPFISQYEGELSQSLNAAGLGFSRELDLIRAGAEAGMLTLGWVTTPEEARQMVTAGAHIIGLVVGITAGGAAGGTTSVSHEETRQKIMSVVDAVKSMREEVLVLGHGGPLTDPESVHTILANTGADGYVTGSTGERLPVEAAVAQTIRQFKAIHLTGSRSRGGK